MTPGAEVSALWTIPTAAFLLAGAALALIGSLGLLRLRGFYERVHAPTLGTTLAAPTRSRRRKRFGPAGDRVSTGGVMDGRVDSSLIIPTNANTLDKQ